MDIMPKNILKSSTKLALQYGFLTQAKRINELLLVSDNKAQTNVDYATAMMVAGYYYQAYTFYEKALTLQQDHEWAKLGCAWCLIEQRKVGWVEILDELSVSSADVSVRSIINQLYARVADILLNYKQNEEK
jgi:tetratricopeptide (TPR) repeat protein